MSNLIIKSPNLPIKAYPPQALELQKDLFMKWITDLLGLRGEESAKRLILAMPVILKKFHSLSFTEVKTAFEMYALGELETKPIPNYFDIILVGQIFNAYKKQQRTKTEPFDEAVYKAEQDKLYAIQAFEYYQGSNKLPEQSVWLYSYLEDTLGVFKFDAKLKKEIYNKHLETNTKEDAVIKAKIDLLKACFDEFISKGTHIKTYLK